MTGRASAASEARPGDRHRAGDGRAFLAGGGEMGERMRAFDWSKTPVGPIECWRQSLRSPLSMLLPSKAQIILFWGPEYVVFYNDAYRPVFGAKHPQVLGQPGRVAWSEIWDTGANLHGLLDGVVRTGEAFTAQDLLFVIERYGFVEETYFDVSYDPVRIESGEVGGVYCIVTETTGRVVGERRMTLLKDLAARNATARTVREACVLAMETLSAKPQDIAFALAYVDGTLQACTPGAEGALAAAKPELVKEIRVGSARLVAGINPQRPFDELYRSFLDLVADQVATGIANARAYEQERKRAEALAELDRAKTAFFSNVSHELRTPLTLMLGPLEESLQDREAPLAPEHRERLGLAQRSGLRLQKLVNTLLDFARIEAGRAQACYVPTDLAALTADLASSFRSAVEKAGLRLVVQCPPLAAPAWVDRDMWEKIVLNLLSNALKFTFHGGITVTLQEADDRIVLAVRDTGIGIPAGELPHVFERFRRIQGARSRTHEGSGIGLALVQELARLHGGTARADSVLGVGSTFTVSIPAGKAHIPAERIGSERTQVSTALGAELYVNEALGWLPDAVAPDADVADPAGSAADPADAAFPPRRRERIVWADDNADMREYVRRLLAGRYEVEAVADGEAALAAVRERQADLVLADVMMPGLDGFGLLAALRADERTRSMPVILLSARAGEEARIEGIGAGADDYLVKPFGARELLARVDTHVRMARERREELADTKLLQHVSAELLQHGGVEDLHEKILDAAVAVMRSDFASMQMLDPERGELELLAFRGFDPQAARLWKWVRTDTVTSCGVALRTGERCIVPDADRCDFLAGSEHLETYRRIGIRAVQSTPLVSRAGRPLGMMSTHWREPHAPTERELRLLDVLARQAADLIERTQTERALRESEQRFRVMADTAPAMLWITDPDGRLTFISRGWHEFTGQTEAEAFGAEGFGWLSAVHPEDRERVEHTLLQANLQHEPFAVEYRLRRADGEYRWAIDAGRPRADGSGAFLGYIGSVIDVHERKRAEQAIAVSEQRYRTIFDNAAVSIWEEDFSAVAAAIAGLKRAGVTDFPAYFATHPEFVRRALGMIRVRDVNAATLTMFEAADKRELLGALPDIFVPESMPVFVGELIALAEGRSYFEGEAELRTVRGNPLYVFFTMVLPEPGETPRSVLFSLHDIGERRRAEQALRDADRRKDEFLAILAHELRNPLAPIRNGLQLIRLAGANPAALDQARPMMERQVQHLVRLVDDLLDVSRISRNRLELRKEWVELAAVVRSAVETSRPVVEAAGHELAVSLPPEPVLLDADPVRLAQAIANLLNNAAKYTEPGGRISLEAERAGAEVVIRVRDTGIGIPAPELPHIFDMFVQVERSLERAQGGLGIGLTLVRRLVELHGGSVAAHSDGPGQGSVFTIRLPVVVVPEAKTAPDRAARDEPEARPSRRILVVDDNRDAADSLTLMLKLLGHEVATAYEGVQAVDVAKAFRPAIVLLDLGMPKLNGYDAARRIRQECGELVVVALTGWGQEEDRQRSREAGFDAHLVKPVDLPALEGLFAGLRHDRRSAVQ